MSAVLDYVTGDGPLPGAANDDDDAATAQGQTGATLSPAQSAALARKWQQELDASKKWLAKFTKNARVCERAYFDERDANGGEESRVNLFWSNVQVILSAIYGKLPQAEVDRKFKDFDDDVARVAAIILERILNGDIEREYDDTNAAMRDAVFDRFVVGLGQVWCRYDVDTEDYQAPQMDAAGQPVIDPATGQPLTTSATRIVNEEAEVDYVYWDDFRYSPCRRWRECRWVARRVYLSKRKLAARFGLTPEQVAMVPFQSKTPGENNAADDVIKATPTKQAAVWELWDKDTNSVCWYVEGCAFVLDYQTDYLQLDDFFPCPQPVVSTTLTRAFLPRSDYAMAQDLYRQMDTINNKLARLQEAVKVAGVYDKNAAGVKTLLSSNTENTLVPVENWAVFTDKGGLKGVVDWMPIDATVNAITQLNQRKQLLQKDLYDVLGISDIMRGASAASETATAQQLKAQYGGARLAAMQNDVARFVSDVMRIRANIISKQFQPDTIKQRSLIDRTPDAPFADQSIALIKQFGMAMHSVIVTSDSLAAPDWEQEKQTRTEFMGAVSNYLMAAGPMVASNPTTGGFLVKLLQWGCAGFKGAASIEGVLDQAAQQLEQAAANPPPPPPPSPQDQKTLADAGKAKADAGKSAADAQKAQAEAARTHEETRAMQAQNNAVIGPEMAAAPAMPPGALGDGPGGMGGPLTPPGGPMMGPTGGPGGPLGHGMPPQNFQGGAPGRAPQGPGGGPPLPAAPGTVAPLVPAGPQLAPPR